MEIRGICEYGPSSHGCASEIIETRERMGLGRLHEEVHMRAPASQSTRPLVSRLIRVQPSCVFHRLSLNPRLSLTVSARYLRIAANEACLMPVFRDFT